MSTETAAHVIAALSFAAGVLQTEAGTNRLLLEAQRVTNDAMDRYIAEREAKATGDQP